jgi:cytochrome c-type biogenesis protein CcmH
MAVTVNLSPALQGQAPPGTMLFVFAKAKGKDGEAVPPMPLAVQRVPVGTFPVTMTLDSSMGMVDGLNLAAFDNYEITARISKGGDVKAQSGDWQGKVAAQKSDKTVSLTITEVVP